MPHKMLNGVTEEEYMYAEVLASERSRAAMEDALREQAKEQLKSRIKAQIKKRAAQILLRAAMWVVGTIIIPALPFIAIGIIAIFGGALLLGILT